MASGTREAWRSVTTKKALRAHFDRSIAGSTATGRDGVSSAQFERDLQKNLIALNHKIRKQTVAFSAYHQILKSKGADKFPREVSLPVVRDRVVFRAMSDLLTSVEPACSIELAQSKVARVIAALESNEFTHFIKLDVVNFYPTISHSWLRAALSRTLRVPELVDLFMDAVATPTLPKHERRGDQRSHAGVPQGLAISNGLAELAVQHVDHAISKDADLAYFRYVDDVLILSRGDRSADLWPRVKSALALANLTAHEVKQQDGKSSVGKISDGFEFLGYRFQWPRVTVRAGSINRLEASIARTFTRYKYAVNGPARASNWQQRCDDKLKWHLDLIISGCVFEGNRLGWLAYFSQIRHHQLLEHLDSLVNKQMVRHGVTSIDPKSFVTSYRHAASRRMDMSGFVPNFDIVTDEEMRQILQYIFFVPASQLGRLSHTELQARFKRKVRGLVVELERDIQAGY